MICTYLWLLSVTGEREVEQRLFLVRDRSVQRVLRGKTQEYINTSQYGKPV